MDALSKQDRRGRLSNISSGIFTVFLVISSIFGDDDVRGFDSYNLLKMIEVILTRTCAILYTFFTSYTHGLQFKQIPLYNL